MPWMEVYARIHYCDWRVILTSSWVAFMGCLVRLLTLLGRYWLSWCGRDRVLGTLPLVHCLIFSTEASQFFLILMLHLIHLFLQVPHHVHRVWLVVECFLYNDVVCHVPWSHHGITITTRLVPWWMPKCFDMWGRVFFLTSGFSLIFKFGSCSSMSVGRNLSSFVMSKSVQFRKQE